MTDSPLDAYVSDLAATLIRLPDITALVLAENGNNQLGRPYPGHPGYRIWDGYLISVGHHDKDKFALEADAILCAHLSVEVADHRYAHLDNQGTWTRCPADTAGAVPITVALARIHHQEDQS
ncbi:hypothetical protein [Streptomyces sp. NPDC056192]|uniref:hypothetical protein n=1 Tax=Streptomyces sp. NPDC056192 TaxID=3345743 RepID=UPI0035DD40A6